MNHDIDVESMLADILGGKEPSPLDTLQDEELLSPPAPEPTPEPEEYASHSQSDSIPSLEDILAGNDPDASEELVNECADEEAQAAAEGKTPDGEDLHACNSDEGDLTQEEHDECVAGLPKLADGSTLWPEHSWAEGMTPEEYEAEKKRRVQEQEDAKAAALEPIDESEWSKEVKVESIKLPEFTSEELMEDLDIRNYGTLVSLNTLRWHAKVRDHRAADAAASASGADKAAFEARKRLLVGADEKLKRVHTAIDAARTEHYKMTLPWSTVGVNDHGKRSGPRLLPNTLFFDYTQKMAKYKQEMDDALDEFVTAYPKLIAIAQQKLGTSFDRSQYPAPSLIKHHFGLSFDFLPIPTGDDFGNVTLQQAEKLAMNVNRKTRQMLENAMQDAWKRLQDDMEHAYNSLKNPNAKFHFTLIEKMKEHSSMLSHLNATKDPRIEAIRARIEKDLAKRDIKDIRKDDALRKHLADEAKAVLDMMQEYVNDCSK
jgi:hypothetical protein